MLTYSKKKRATQPPSLQDSWFKSRHPGNLVMLSCSDEWFKILMEY